MIICYLLLFYIKLYLYQKLIFFLIFIFKRKSKIFERLKINIVHYYIIILINNKKSKYITNFYLFNYINKLLKKKDKKGIQYIQCIQCNIFQIIDVKQ